MSGRRQLKSSASSRAPLVNFCISFALVACTAIYIFTNRLLMRDRSKEELVDGGIIAPGAEGDEPEEEEEEGWWLPPPSAILSYSNQVQSRRLLGEESSTKDSDRQRMTPSHLLRIMGKLSNCDEVNRISNLSYLGSGWTKVVYRGWTSDGQDVAVKIVDRQGYDVRRCVKNENKTAKKCEKKASEKLLREAFVLQSLRNPFIVPLLYICLPPSDDENKVHSGPSLVTELGETMDIIKLLQMSWEDRLRLSFSLSKLLNYLAHSPYGSVVINDFRRQQFVIVDGDLKLVDVDDVGFDETSCIDDAQCKDQLSGNNASSRLNCLSGRCVGLNEMKNIINAGHHFMSILLPHGAPHILRPVVKEIIDAHSSATTNAQDLLERLTKLVELYSKGSYLQRNNKSTETSYTKIVDSDLPGQFDYRCLYSIATSGCTVSVFDQKEAEDLCDYDPQCQAFVLSFRKSWTGRIFAHLKNNISAPMNQLGTSLFVRRPI